MDKNDIKILIIDDEPLVASSVECFLEDRDWNVVVDESGEDALETIVDETIKFAIVDIRLGGMTGEEFIREAYLKRPDIIYIICTGSPNYTVDESLYQIPALYKQIFKKPVKDLSVLETTIAELAAK